MMTSGVLISALFQVGFKMLSAIVGIVIAWYLLKFLDYTIDGDSFAETFKDAGTPDKMRYFSWRFMAVCILIGLVIS